VGVKTGVSVRIRKLSTGKLVPSGAVA
jgi:hypothetical protein